MFLRRIVLCTSIAMIVAALVNGCSPGTSAPGISANSPDALSLQATVDLGVIFQGASVKYNQWIKNSGRDSVRISKIECSCECLEVRLSRDDIPPGERALAQFRYDGAAEATFIGLLDVEVVLIDNAGKTVGKINVPVEVIADTQMTSGNETSKHGH